MTVRLEKSSAPACLVVHDPNPGQTISLSWSQAAGNRFDFTGASGRAFNQSKSEAGTAQVSAFVYLGAALQFGALGSGGWTPSYVAPQVTGSVNASFQLPCDNTLAGYLQWFVRSSASRTCTGSVPPLLRNCAVSSILCHEYSHHFTQNLWLPGALHTYTDEIFADVFSSYLTGDPIIGRNIFGTGQHRRNLTELWIYPVTGTGDPLHDSGRPHTGAMWELRQGLIAAQGAAAGATTANQLLFEWIRRFRTWPKLPSPNEALLIQLLLADDALFDVAPEIAPPHGELIAQAFGHHNLLVPFIRGDANGDATVDVSDTVRILLYLSSGATITCLDAADGNDDGRVDISDSVYLLANLFQGGPSPPAPFPGCGTDFYDSDALFCAASPCMVTQP